MCSHALACGCNAVGSVGIACSLDGLCTCRPGFAGPHCDRCDASSPSPFPNCSACPSCAGAWASTLNSLESYTDGALAPGAPVYGMAAGMNATQLQSVAQDLDASYYNLVGIVMQATSVDVAAAWQHATGVSSDAAVVVASLQGDEQRVDDIRASVTAAQSAVDTELSVNRAYAQALGMAIDGVCGPAAPGQDVALSLMLGPSSNAVLNMETGAWYNNISTLFKTHAAGQIIWFGTPGAGGDKFSLRVTEAGAVEGLVVVDGAWVRLTSPATLPSFFDDMPHAVQLLRSPSGIKMVIDGEVVYGGALAGVLDTDGAVLLGHAPAVTQVWSGCIAMTTIDGVPVAWNSPFLMASNPAACPLGCRPLAVADVINATTAAMQEFAVLVGHNGASLHASIQTTSQTMATLDTSVASDVARGDGAAVAVAALGAIVTSSRTMLQQATAGMQVRTSIP
jgi:hypothetical protein